MTTRGTSDAMGSSGSGRSPGAGGDRLQEAASNVADRVGGTAQQQLDSGLSRAGDVLEQVANAVRHTGEELRGEQPQIASIADTAASQVDKAARYVRETDMQGIVGRAERFARQQPAIFVGGALMLGLVAARFLKASPSGASGSYQGYGAGYHGTTDRWPANEAGGWDPTGTSRRGIQSTDDMTTGGGSITRGTAATSADAGVLEHGRA
jgi:ElaB/YqjD/DUF883 family membrane-anchored ribosome-binding protein